MKKKNHGLDVVTLLILIFLTVNFIWIVKYSPAYNSEDMQILTHSVNLAKSKDKLEFKNYYNMETQPVMPVVHYFGLKYIPNEFTPLFVNSLFMIILIFSVYGITKLLYTGKAGLLASFLIITVPTIIAFSRTIYTGFLLTALFALNVYLFLKSDNFSNVKWSILWCVSSIVCLLTKYSMIAYITAVLFASIIFFLQKVIAKDISKELIIKYVSVIILLGILVGVTVLPLYKQGLSNYQTRKNNLPKSSFVCDVFNYPAFLLNVQLGFVLFVFFFVSLIYIIKEIIKKKIIRKEIMILLTIIFVYFFFSFFTKIKNNEVTLMILPLIVILISGFVIQRKTWLKVAFISILVINGLFFVLPVTLDNSLNEISFLTKLSSKLNCASEHTPYYINQNYYFFNKNTGIDKQGLLDYTVKNKTIRNINNIIFSHDLPQIIVLDLGPTNHFEMDYYAYITNSSVQFRYMLCQGNAWWWRSEDYVSSFWGNPDKETLVTNIDFVMLYKALNNATCSNCYQEEYTSECGKLIEFVQTAPGFSLLATFPIDDGYTNLLELRLYKVD